MWKANGLLKAKRLNGLSVYIQSTGIRWTLTLIWTVVAVKLMLSPSGNGTTVSWVANLFGNTEMSNATGHVIINAILALLWCRTISLYATRAITIRLIFTGGIIWCFAAELSQYFVPERGTSLLDLGANILGVVIGLAVYQFLGRFE